MKPKILLLSGYDAASHQYWRKQLEQNLQQFDWTQVALPAHHFSWRTRGSSLELATLHRQVLQENYDLVVATSMVDLSALRGFLPNLAQIPTIVYFHENQFVYPVSHQQPNILNAQLTSIYSAICGDFLLFNSCFNHNSFMDGVEKLLKKLPSKLPPNISQQLKDKAAVIPVPVFSISSKNQTKKHTSSNEKVTILWNHRWEYDKQPEVFFSALKMFKQKDYQFELNVVGESFKKIPKIFEWAKGFFKSEINYWGYQNRSNYQKALLQSDWIISTATHDFQGLSVLEAIASGCIPFTPNRLAYCEYVPESQRYELLSNNNSENDSIKNDSIENNHIDNDSAELEAKALFKLLEKQYLQPFAYVPNIARYQGNKNNTENNNADIFLEYANCFQRLIKK